MRLEPDVLFVDDGDILTAAGSAAALDLALHVVRKDFGAEVTNSVSGRLERLGDPLTVAGLAARAGVSPATLHRRFRARLGTTPLAWLTGERRRFGPGGPPAAGRIPAAAMARTP